MRKQFKRMRPGVRKTRLASKAYASKQTVNLTPPVRRAVKAIIKGQAETKHAAFYESYDPGTANPPVVSTGLFSGRGYRSQNNQISSNISDIHQLIPFVAEGTDNYQRIGKKINVQSLFMYGSVRVAIPILAAVPVSPVTNLSVVIYILQHKTLKAYPSLRSLNDFNELLEVDEGSAVSFKGAVGDEKLPVQNEVYTLCQKKILKLKWAGNQSTNATTAPDANLSIANSHVWKADYSLNLTRHVPKNLLYPDTLNSVPPTTYNAPTNSSLFMAIGFVNDAVIANASATGVATGIEQYYYTRLAFKDM